MTKLDYALALARLGFRIFPLMPGTKRPYPGVKWYDIRTTDEATIRGWIAERPDMNYAVNPREDQIILDLDEGQTKDGKRVKRGILNFGELEASNADFDDAKFDDTFVVESPKHGLHGYFTGCTKAYSNGVAKALAEDMDVRGSGGYVVGPGSVTDDLPEENTAAGEYRAITAVEDMKALPGWIAKRFDATGATMTTLVEGDVGHVVGGADNVDKPHQIKCALEIIRNRRPAIEGQRGDREAVYVAEQVGDEGISEDKCLELMFSEKLFPPDAAHPEGRSWNDMCQPPWDFDELAVKVHNGYTYRTKPIGAKTDLLALVGVEDIAGALDEDGEMAAIAEPEVESPRARIRANKFVGFDLFLGRDVNTDMIAPDWIPATGYTAIKAKRGTGKTVFMYDLAARLGCDMDWHNGIKLDKDWAIVYLCGEDDIGLQLHIEAWKKVHDRSPEPGRFIIYTLTPDLMSGTEVALWAQDIRETVGNRRVITFVDTWQRATSRASQNDDREMQTAIHNAAALAKEVGGPMIIACHPPKSNSGTISGAFVIENHSSCIIHIENEGMRRRATVERIKGAQENSYIGMTYEKIDLGRTDKFGKKVTGLVPVANSGTGMAMSEQLMADQHEVMSTIGRMLSPQMDKGTISFKDAGAWLHKFARDNPASKVGAFGANMEDEDEAVKRLRSLFPSGCKVFIDENCTMCADEKKLKLGGEVSNPTDSPETPEMWERR